MIIVRKKNAVLDSLQNEKKIVMKKINDITDIDTHEYIQSLYKEAQMLEDQIVSIKEENKQRINEYKNLRQSFTIAKETHNYFMNKMSYMLAMPWKSIVIAGEAIFNISNTIIDKPTSTFVATAESPAIDVDDSI